MKIEKTNAMRILDRLKISYRVYTYDVSDGHLDGEAVARKINRDPEMVFKTLVCRGGSGLPCVFCIPVKRELDLKAAARAVGEKSVSMLPLAELTAVTGYKRGGCSPIGMKKQFATFVEASALRLDSVLVSGGQVGVQIEVSPEELIRVANAGLLGL